jgi:hypothetical protein
MGTPPKQPTVTLLGEEAQRHWDQVETQAIIRTIERLAAMGRLKGDKEVIARLLGVSLLS